LQRIARANAAVLAEASRSLPVDATEPDRRRQPITMLRLAPQTSLPSAVACATAYGGARGADTVLPGVPVCRIRAPLCWSAR